MSIYQELGVKTVINAVGTYTVVGATRMSATTLRDLCEAAHEFVEIETLQKAVHRKVAELTRNEAAYLCNSCSTAIYLAAAAFVEKHCSRNFNLLSHEEIAQYEVVALKTVLAEADLIPILIFDEIDANIGGETATKVAGEIAVLAANKQILCISHLPQIASRANIHFNVSKESKGEATHTHIRQLDHAGRVQEIARMLGGGTDAGKLASKMLQH